MATIQEKAYLAWTGTLGIHADTIRELAQPAVVARILKDIDAEFFHIRAPNSNDDQFLAKLRQLKSIVAQMEKYYLQLTDNVYVDTPNVVALLARDDTAETLKLLKMCMILAVECDKKEMYIGQIMQLEEEVQRAIMNIIEPTVGSEPDGNAQGDLEFVLEQEVAKLLADKARDAQEMGRLQERVEALEQENGQLKNNSNSNSNNQSGDHSPAVVTHNRADDDEVAEMKDHIADLEVRLKTSQDTVREHEQTIKEMSELSTTSRDSDQVVANLQQQLKESEQQVARLSKVESVAERYKRKLQDSKDLEKQVEYLEKENHELRRLGRTTSHTAFKTREDKPEEGGGEEEGDTDGQDTMGGDTVEQIRVVLDNEAQLSTQFEKLVNNSKRQSHQIKQLTQELELVSSAWFSIASRIQQQNVAVMRKSYDSPKGWLSRQRQQLDRVLL